MHVFENNQKNSLNLNRAVCARSSVYVAFFVFSSCTTYVWGKNSILTPWRFALGKKFSFCCSFLNVTVASILSLGWKSDMNWKWMNRIHPKAVLIIQSYSIQLVTVIILYCYFLRSKSGRFLFRPWCCRRCRSSCVLMCDFCDSVIRMKFHVESQIEKHKFWRIFIGSNFKSHVSQAFCAEVLLTQFRVVSAQKHRSSVNEKNAIQSKYYVE